MGLHILTFPTDNVDPSNTLQLKISILEITAGSGSYNANAVNVWVKSYGSQSWQYDLDDPFIVPSELKIVLSDPDKWIHDFYFGASEDVIHKPAEVELTLNASQEFLGNLITDSVEWDEAERTFSFSAAPDVEKINDQVIILDDDTIVNPFSYTTPFADWPQISTFIEDIFKQVNSGITVDWYHSWELYNAYTGWEPLAEHHYTPDNHYLDASNIGELGLKTTGDVLRKLAFEWGAYTGLISNDVAFFKEFYGYDSGNLMTLGTVKNFLKNYRYPSITYIRVSSVDGRPSYEVGSEANAGLDNKYVKDNVSPYIGTGFTSIYHPPWSGPSPKWTSQLRCTRISVTTTTHVKMLGDYIYYYRRSGSFYDNYKRVDRFIVEGLDYRIDKNFQYGGISYRCVSLEKKYDSGDSILDAVIID